MDPETQKSVDLAAGIAESGRWAAVTAKLEALAVDLGTGTNEPWHVKLLASLCFQVFSEYAAVKHAYENPQRYDAALLAWRSRNLLELAVWSDYTIKARDNARRLYEDAGRDVNQLYDLFLEWGTGRMAADWLDPFETAKKDLSERARLLDNIESLDGRYKQVRDAANEIGFGRHFTVCYRMLSKFAHPTAMQILAVPDDERTAKQRDVFFSYACLFFAEAFRILEAKVLSLATC